MTVRMLAILIVVYSMGVLYVADYMSSDSKKETRPKEKAVKVYTIAFDDNNAPFSMTVNGENTGIDVELLKAISKIENINYQLKPMAVTDIIPALLDEQIDGTISGVNITAEQKKNLDFSEPYYKSGITGVDNEQKNIKTDLNSVQNLPPINGLAVAKDENRVLLRKFNMGLIKIKQNGTYDTIVKKYQ